MLLFCGWEIEAWNKVNLATFIFEIHKKQQDVF